GADVVTDADREAEAAVVELLRRERPDDGVLGEEGARRDAGRTWLVVALDGAVGVLRTGGAGSLDLAWVATGRLDAWIQRRPAPWDWWPGALLVREAGGTVMVDERGWHVAGAPDV